MVIVRAKLDAKRVGSYEGRDYCSLQFILYDERGAIKLVEVNLPDGADHSAYVVGKIVEISVSVSASKTGKIYYRAIPHQAIAA